MTVIIHSITLKDGRTKGFQDDTTKPFFVPYHMAHQFGRDRPFFLPPLEQPPETEAESDKQPAEPEDD